MKPFSLSLLISITLGLYLAAKPTSVYCAEQLPIELSISEAVRMALKNNLNLKLRLEDVVVAEGSAQEAEAPFDALISADVGATEETTTPVTIEGIEQERTSAWNASVLKRFTPGTEVDLSWKNGNLDTDSNFYLFDPIYNTGVKVGVTQPLLKGLGQEVQLAELKAARKQLAAQSFLVDSEAANLAAQVKSAYWELVFAHQNLDVLKLALALAEKLRNDTEAKITAGKLASIDIYQPESEVARREEELISGERAIGFAEDNLKLLLNSQDWLTPFKTTDVPETSPINPQISTILEKALANRPDIKAAALQIQASEYQLRKAKDNILPALDIFGAVGFGGTADTYGNALDSSLNDAETQWQIGLSFSRPFNNSLAEGQYRQANAFLNKNRTSLELLKQDIRRTVRVTVRDVELALKAIDATNKTAIATQKRLEAEQIKFDAGRSTTLDVLIAQQDYSNALSAENSTKVIYAQTLAELDRIQGIIRIAE
ncbi:MAG: TolC family protein [Desulfobacterales bacterium]|nr:TolC family protein [Deltaproteobacteria bacterium]MBT8359636.1 TolC family protein [Deltaproteobacteria bacterium]NNK93503.1 TolC family protein [Desulfobacterales bacterium]